jgi:subtilisin family serine protease
VAVIDSGIEPGTDFDNRITAFYDFTGGDIRAVAPMDPYGHGTHVAGLIASECVGVAPTRGWSGFGCSMRMARARRPTRAAPSSSLREQGPLGINVLNLSLGHPIYEPAATDPLGRQSSCHRKGIVVVVSAGSASARRAFRVTRHCIARRTPVSAHHRSCACSTP